MKSAYRVLKIPRRLHRRDENRPVAPAKSGAECWARLKDDVVQKIKRSRRRYPFLNISKLWRRRFVDPETKPLLDQTEDFCVVGELDEHAQFKPTSLDELSSEILLIITTFLPLSSSAALCLVNRIILWNSGLHSSNSSTRTSHHR
jgi:hypothetical protein